MILALKDMQTDYTIDLNMLVYILSLANLGCIIIRMSSEFSHTGECIIYVPAFL